jgi:hypothetical protein
VTRLNHAIAGTSAADVADAFGEISAAAVSLADAVVEANAVPHDSRVGGRARGAA